MKDNYMSDQPMSDSNGQDRGYIVEGSFFELPKGKNTWIVVLCISLAMVLLALLLGLAANRAFDGFIEGKLGKVNQVEEESTISDEEESEILDSGGTPIESGDDDYVDIDDIIMPGETSKPTDPDPGDNNPGDVSPNPTDPVPSVPGETKPPATTAPTKPIVPDSPKGDIVNILLIGQDRRPGESRCRSDSMILMTFNKTTNTFTMTSFMRDALVEIPGYKPYKLNHAYQYGGMSLLNETLKVNYGVDVDGDIAVDFSQFEQLIDKLGGVDITLTKKEADHLNLGNNWGLKAGKVRLTGAQALRYSRLRYIDNDYQRAGRQREVIDSLINRYMSLPILDMIEMLDVILPLVSTNMTKNQLKDMILELAPMLATAKQESAQIPAPGTFKGGYVKIRDGFKDWFQYNIDFNKNREILREIFDAD